MGTTVTFHGKLRKNEYMNSVYGKTIKSITSDTLWPDAWKIDVKLKDLTPNNFNTYIEYFTHGFGSEQSLTALQDLDQTRLGVGLAITDQTMREKVSAAAVAEAQKARTEQDEQFIATYLINQQQMTNANNANVWNTLPVVGSSQAEIQRENMIDNTKNSNQIRAYNRERSSYLREAVGEIEDNTTRNGLSSSVRYAQNNIQKSTDATFIRDNIDRRTVEALQREGQ